MKNLMLRTLAGVAVTVCLSGAGSASADPVLDWNGIAAQAYATAVAAGRPGQIGPLDFAMVHVAVFDAVEAFDRRFKPYHVEIQGASGSPIAAVAKAAHDVLLNLYPAQSDFLDKAYDDYLAANGLAQGDPGVFVGQQAAAGIINLRTNDGRFPSNPPVFTGGTSAGEWRPTPSYNLPPGAPAGTPPGPPPSFAPMAVVWLGTVVPFTLRDTTQFRADPPPALTSHEYLRAYKEVKRLGSLLGSARTPEQTDLGYFYADNFVLIWNRALRAIAAAHVHKIGDSARLFALAYLAEADAGITAWDSKRFFAFWRPLTAIQEGDSDGNPATRGDPTWRPLINTPNYPDYTSGANNLTGAVTRILSLFFGTDKMTFSVTSNYPLAIEKTRTYDRFSDAAQDVVDVRVYQGIHFRFADTAARRQGRLVAKWTFRHFLRPLDDHDDHDDDNDHDRDR